MRRTAVEVIQTRYETRLRGVQNHPGPHSFEGLKKEGLKQVKTKEDIIYMGSLYQDIFLLPETNPSYNIVLFLNNLGRFKIVDYTPLNNFSDELASYLLDLFTY